MANEKYDDSDSFMNIQVSDGEQENNPSENEDSENEEPPASPLIIEPLEDEGDEEDEAEKNPESLATSFEGGLEQYIDPAIWDEIDFDDEDYNTSLMVEYLCLQRFPVIQIFDGRYLTDKVPDNFPGRLINRYRSESRLYISEYQYCIMISVGEMAFTEYGNYSRMIKTLYEVLPDLIPRVMQRQNWQRASFLATHERYENIAWAISVSLGITVDSVPPTGYANEILHRLQSKVGKEWYKKPVAPKA